MELVRKESQNFLQSEKINISQEKRGSGIKIKIIEDLEMLRQHE
jgi:hypothetical protein